MHFTFIALILVIWFSYCTQLLVNYLGRHFTFLLHICSNILRHKDTASLMFSCLYQTPRTLEDQPCCPYLTWVCLFSPLEIWEDLYHLWVSACCVLRPAPLDPDAFHLIPLSPAPPQSIYTCLSFPCFLGCLVFQCLVVMLCPSVCVLACCVWVCIWLLVWNDCLVTVIIKLFKTTELLYFCCVAESSFRRSVTIFKRDLFREVPDTGMVKTGRFYRVVVRMVYS